MQNKEKNKKGGGNFRNDPFRSLKGITTRSLTRANEPPPRVSASNEEEDSEQLFLRAAEGVKRIGQADGSGQGSQGGQIRKDGTAATAGDGESALFQEAMRTLGAPTVGERHRDQDNQYAESRRSASSRMRQLKRGTIHITEELDLHGYMRDDAVRRLAHFIGSAYARGREAVLVITGKGLNSPDGPVLQGAVREWLRTAGSRMVAEFHAGTRERGGSGAVVVFLRRKRERK